MKCKNNDDASGRMKLFECVELVDAAAHSVKSRSGAMNAAKTKKNAKEDVFVDEENDDDVIDERHKVRKLNTFGDDTERQRMMEKDFCLRAGGSGGKFRLVGRRYHRRRRKVCFFVFLSSVFGGGRERGFKERAREDKRRVHEER